MSRVMKCVLTVGLSLTTVKSLSALVDSGLELRVEEIFLYGGSVNKIKIIKFSIFTTYQIVQRLQNPWDKGLKLTQQEMRKRICDSMLLYWFR